jgi:glycosyltransferase involved in cell wall biosynthesis
MFASHFATSGPADALEEYAGPRAARLVAVYHAFPYAEPVVSRVRRWRGGSVASERRRRWSSRVPGPVTWAKEVVQTAWWGLWTPGRVDVFVGIDALNAAAGLLLRAVRRVDRVVFWTIDYAPDRFSNRLLNRVYHEIDRICVACADETWNLSPRMQAARRSRGARGRQRVVPMGARARAPVPAAYPHRVVFMGSLLAKQGVQEAIRALGLVRETVPDAHLLVIGDGPQGASLERIVAEQGLDGAVEFAGYVEDHAQVEELIAESGVALAPYDPETAGFTYFADPGKIKNYLAMGVPVVVTDVPWSAGWLSDAGAGVVVEYTPAAIARGILDLLDDPASRRAAGELGARSDWRAIFDDAFASLLGEGERSSREEAEPVDYDRRP